jgi:hypothetical protein
MKRVLVLAIVLLSPTAVGWGQLKPLSKPTTIDQCRQFANRIETGARGTQEEFSHMFDSSTYKELMTLSDNVKACSELDSKDMRAVYNMVHMSLLIEQTNRLQQFLIDQQLLQAFVANDRKTHGSGR